MISGLQKMTLLDFPGKVACTVFLQRCNYRCPFCHNSDLLDASGPEGMTDEALLAFLKKRQGLLDGVAITGGEPTLYPDLEPLLQQIRDLGYAIKLDTNGTRPEVLMRLAEKGLVDYVAMDLKNAPALYAQTAGVSNPLLENVEASIRFLINSDLDFEFRTTVVDGFHDEATISGIGQWLQKLCPEKKAPRYFIQSYVDRDSVLVAGLQAPAKETLNTFVRAAAPYFGSVQLRGVD